MSGYGDLHRYFLNNSSFTVTKWFHYLDIYEHHFQRFRNRPINLLEIGVFRGGSSYMWRDYFAEDSNIVGIDIDPSCKQYEGENIDIHIGSQDDNAFLKSVIDQYDDFDIIIDDGSHQCTHVNNTFDFLYPKMSKNGVYLIEDVHTSYWPHYGGGLGKEGSIMEVAKAKLDELNAIHIEDMDVSDLTRTTQSVSFYDSIIVYEKRLQSKRKSYLSKAM